VAGAGGWWLVAGPVAGNWWLLGGWWRLLIAEAPYLHSPHVAKTATIQALFKYFLTISHGTRRAICRRMNSIETYRDLEAWQFGMTLVERCYAETKGFPVDERYGLTAQLRRAAISIPSNVAEGACRRTTNAYINHVSIALGSHAELETCVAPQVTLRVDAAGPRRRRS
jgi:four helix bundle protein